MKNDEIMSIEDMTVYMRIAPERKASYAEFPDTMNDEIKEYLRKQGTNALYTHQTEMFERAGQGENTVITTSTASGKTLAFLLPVLEKILEDPLTRAIFIYPTKALASDQYRALQPILEYFGAGKIQAGVYDGDTMPAERSRIRKSANIILTNPEMLNSAFLPNHSKYGFDFIFANLKYIVIDELHSYRGAFGAHLANIFRRMHRICQYYHSEPQFLCSSATIANPVELAENVCGTTFSLIEKDGSPSPIREYRIIQPPEIKGHNDKTYGRYAASTVAVNLLPDLVEEGRHFITFGKSRRNVEVILKEARDKLNAAGFLSRADSSKIAGYRGGYTPLERKEIERKMMSGELNGLVSTNALELGIDIGSLDTTVLVGYPGTRASFWQQSGRAGRNGQTCVNYLILENLPIDQYIAVDPGWLFEGKSENAIVDPDNLLIELAHIRSAAAELPLSLDDAALFHSLGEIIPVLMKAEEVKSMAGRFAWSGPAFPAGDYSLRNMDKTRFKLILDEENREITEMDETQAYHELHPDAVYMHEGALYEVLNLDLERKTATAKPFEGNYYTVPEGTEEIRILQTFEEKMVERAKVHFGDINVDEVILGYKKLQFHNHQNLGFGTLRQPLQKDYDTESAWIDMPEDVVRVYRRLLIPNKAGELVLNNHFDGMENAIKNAAMMVTMTERDDIDTGMSNNATVPGYVSLESGESEENEVVSLFIYDKYEGGLGYSEKIYELLPEVIDHAIQMVKGCPCEDGCPACVGDYTLSKKMVLWGLESLKEKLEAPEYVKKQIEEERPSVQKKYSFFKLPEKWKEFCESVIKNGESGGAFLKTVKRVETEQHKLILIVDNYFYEDWLKVPENARSIKNILKYHAVCPGDMEIIVRTEEDAERKKKTEGKLKRRYEDKF